MFRYFGIVKQPFYIAHRKRHAFQEMWFPFVEATQAVCPHCLHYAHISESRIMLKEIPAVNASGIYVIIAKLIACLR